MIPHCQVLSSTTRIKYLISLHLFPTNGTRYCTYIQYFCANPLLSVGYCRGTLYLACCLDATDSYTTSGVGGRVLEFICTHGDPSPLVLGARHRAGLRCTVTYPTLCRLPCQLPAHAPAAHRYQPARHSSAPVPARYGRGRGRGYGPCPYGQGAGAIAGRVPQQSRPRVPGH